jgi:hypothetical protein
VRSPADTLAPDVARYQTDVGFDPSAVAYVVSWLVWYESVIDQVFAAPLPPEPSSTRWR